MYTCRNVIEELVIEEARNQISRLGQRNSSQSEQVDLSEVAAYALNRLPTLYATSQRGWLQQHRRAKSELKDKIEHSVRRAMLGVKKDALRVAMPLPHAELEDQARSLAKLQKILGKDDLTWKDIPTALEDALIAVKLKGAVRYNYLSTKKRNALYAQDYLKRSKPNDSYWKSSKIDLSKFEEEAQNAQDLKDFESYMSKASCNFSNTLENLLRSIVYRQIQKLEPSIAENINIEEVVAYALNRLPPMYATSAHGLSQLRNRAKLELSTQIATTLREAISIILKSPVRVLPPLPLEKFNQEQEQALEELKEILQINDLSWRNVAEVVEDTLKRTLSGETSWKVRDREQVTSAKPQV